jgi:homoserine dehydrogenase
MQTVRLALIGFGNVGRGFAQILVERGDQYAEKFGLQFVVVAVNDMLRGCAYNPAGLDLTSLLQTTNISELPDGTPGWDAITTIARCNADVIVEITYTNLQTGEPANSHIRAALESGKHVVTSNKGPVALKYADLSRLARAHGVKIGVEGTVMSGTPALYLGQEQLAGAGITRIQGIFNGTTNYILTNMENGVSYVDALAEAQSLGYAEADPSGDVEGFDAAGKVAILSTLLMDNPIEMGPVERVGITGLTTADVEEARANGKRWKLIGNLEKKDGKILASVKPELLPLSHPLASVSGTTNAITYTTDLLGDITLIGPGSGRLQTGFALVSDLLGIYWRCR